jgi:hypothetical protein
MTVKVATSAYLTTYSSGVFTFDPAQAASNPGTAAFGLIRGTDSTVSYQDAYYDADQDDLFVAVNAGVGPDGLMCISTP